MKELVSLMDRETELFEELKNAVVDQKMAMIDRDIESMNEALSRIERISMEIEKMDELRGEMFSKLRSDFGLPDNASVFDILNKLDPDSREEMLDSLSKFLRSVNDLAAELQGVKEMLDFEKAYFDFMKSLVTPTAKSGTYSRKGEYRNMGTGGVFDTRW